MATSLSQSKIPLQPFYTPNDTAGLDYATLQDPGTYPYTRGRRAGAGATVQVLGSLLLPTLKMKLLARLASVRPE